jgi:phosphate transport system permease protein
MSADKGRAGAIGDGVFHTLTFLFAALVLLILGGVIVSLIAGVPVAFGVAVFITEISPIWLKRPLATMIELLAAIPSIIYGIWGLFVFAPFVQQYIQPAIINSFGQIPGIGALFAGPPLGIGILTAGFILGIMVLPFISSIMRDVFETVPPMLKESAYGLGATRSEVVWQVVLPFTRVGVVGGVMLGLGRRDHGRDFCNRQCASHQRLDPAAGNDDIGIIGK